MEIVETRPNSVDFKNIELKPNDKALTELTFTDFLIEYNQCARRFTLILGEQIDHFLQFLVLYRNSII